MELLTEQLQSEAGIDPLADRFKTGYIAAVKDFILVDIEEIQTND